MLIVVKSRNTWPHGTKEQENYKIKLLSSLVVTGTGTVEEEYRRFVIFRSNFFFSGIGRSVAVLFAREGANVVICYNSNTEDAEKTKGLVEKEGRQAFTIQADIGIKHNCNKIIEQTVTSVSKVLLNLDASAPFLGS